MGQVAVTINGRMYRLACREGEEERLRELAEHVAERVEGLIAEHGQVGDTQMVLMAAILISDELWDARERLADRDFEQGDPEVPNAANDAAGSGAAS